MSSLKASNSGNSIFKVRAEIYQTFFILLGISTSVQGISEQTQTGSKLQF